MCPRGVKCTATKRPPSNARAVTADCMDETQLAKSQEIKTFRAGGATALANNFDLSQQGARRLTSSLLITQALTWQH
jgi:hypothetical protein